MLDNLISEATRFLFFTGKGGVGKTSISSTVAVALADSGRRVLLVSTDPASNLSEVLDTPVGRLARDVQGVDGLEALDIDPEAAAAAYRDRVIGPYRGVLPDAVVDGMEEQLSGACTVEIAAFDEFTGLLSDPEATAGWDHVVFDTAPTGHTLRLLALPEAWTDFLDANKGGATCIGPLSGLTQTRERYRVALDALADTSRSTLVLVTRPEAAAIEEAARAGSELSSLGLDNQRLVVNGMFQQTEAGDPTAQALSERQAAALSALPPELATLPREEMPLLPTSPIGPSALRGFIRGTAGTESEEVVPVGATTSLAEIADRLANRGHGLVMTMGKGGVGKTTIAAALAVDLARRGIDVTLSTTDPAAHLDGALGDPNRLPESLTVERVDPESATSAHVEEVMATTGSGLGEDARELLAEDLRSPCTAEIAVFKAFASTVSQASERIVVLDTAPTGHTLLLLDAAQGYQRDATRLAEDVPDGVADLLPRLRDPDYTTVLVVTLPEQTPVHEAAGLQHDLERAGIRPAAWIANQSLSATSTSDPVLAARARHESRWLGAIVAYHSELAVVGWQQSPPSGADNLAALISRADQVAAVGGPKQRTTFAGIPAAME